MIINTSGRTDTVRYYTDWLLNRFDEGLVMVRNPIFLTKVTRYDLTPDSVDCILFCSKDYRPLLPHIESLFSRFNTHFSFTITPYGSDIEPGSPAVDTALDTLVELAGIVGSQRVVWRYDPVLITPTHTVEYHFEMFNQLAARLKGHVSHCVFSFVEMHEQLKLAMPHLVPLTLENKKQLAAGLGRIAASHGIALHTCCTNSDFRAYGIRPSGCATLDVLGRANGVQFRKLKHDSLRPGCHCMGSRDIGVYDTCLNGCKYCYATKDHARASENRQLHDPTSPLLIGHVQEDDHIQQGKQQSFLAHSVAQESLLF